MFSDVVDWVTSNLIDQTKSRKQVLKKLKELMLLVDYKGRKKTSKTPKTWTAQEESNLQELFEQFKDSEGKWPFVTFSLLSYIVFSWADPLGNIIQNLDVARPKNRVVEKLLVMGLIRDRKEIHKKRSRQSRKCKLLLLFLLVVKTESVWK